MVKKLSYEELIKKHSDFLNRDIPKFEIPRKSFLECSGLNYKELVNSNLLEFYFDPSEQHKLGDLFLQSIFSFLDEKTRLNIEDKFEKVEVIREQTTESGRIDLIIYGYLEGSEKIKSVIIIENKIHHSSDGNPFNDYWNSVTEVSKKYKVGVLLTLKPEVPPKNFINITHLQLIDRVLKNIGSRISEGDDRHLLFLKDYKLTIDNLTKPTRMDDSLKFVYEHGSKITELMSLRKDVFKNIKEQCKDVIKDINKFGFTYKFNSSNPHSFGLNCYKDDIIIRHYIHYWELFSNKKISIHTYSTNKDLGEFNEYYDTNRDKFEHLNIDDGFYIDDVDKWSGSIIYGEMYFEEIPLEEVLNFGDFFKEQFIYYNIPFEKKLRTEYQKFIKNK